MKRLMILMVVVFANGLLAETVQLLGLNQTSGNAAFDSSSYDNDANVIGQATWLESSNSANGGQWCNELMLDGATYIDLGGDTEQNFTGSFTIEAWIKPSQVVGYDRVFSRSSTTAESIALWIKSADVIDFVIYFDSIGSKTARWQGESLLDGNYHHVVGRYNADDNSLRVFVDGVQGSVAYGDDSITSVGTWKCGGKLNSSSQLVNYYSGLVDEIRLSNTALDPGWSGPASAEIGFYAGPLVECSLLEADLNGDGIVDFKDFAEFSLSWLNTAWWYSN